MYAEKVIAVGYYNVIFYLTMKNEVNMAKFNYLAERIQVGENLVMRDIYSWCRYQRIEYRTKFYYRKDFSVPANLWNFYSYLRGKWDAKNIVN